MASTDQYSRIRAARLLRAARPAPPNKESTRPSSSTPAPEPGTDHAHPDTQNCESRCAPEIKTGVEACDLLGPDNELIHLRRVMSSASFAHLCNQGTTSAQVLTHYPSAVKAFAENVARIGTGRHVAGNFRPRTVVLAFPLRRSSSLNLADLSALSRASLTAHIHAMNALAVAVEVVGIMPAR